jgi:ubiquinone/menaquinone biosynthesis C-methylase UbiE
LTAKPQEKPRTEQLGLSRNWEEASYALSQILDKYEKVNHVISFGTDDRLRESRLKLVLVTGAEILDLGCGPGTMSQAAVAVEPNLKTIFELDALPAMARLRSFLFQEFTRDVRKTAN